MKPYDNPGSGIEAYSHGDNWIRLQFEGGEVSDYRTPVVPRHQLEVMKGLAESQDGLNTYLNQNRSIRRADMRIS